MSNKNKSKKKQSLGRIGRVEREHRYNMMIRIATIAIVGIVLLVAIGGVIWNAAIVPSKTIAVVGDEEIKMGDFMKRVKMERDRLVYEYNLYQNFASQIQDQNQAQQYYLYLQTIEAQLEPETIGQTTINQMIDEILVRWEAERLGITVTEDEVDTFLNEMFGYSADGVLPPDPTSPAPPTPEMSPTQLALITPTPKVDGAAEAPPIEQPAPTSVTLEEFEQNKGDYFDRMKEFNVNEDFFRGLVRAQLYRDKLNAELAKGVAYPTQEEVWARHILIEPDPEAEDQEAALEEARIEAEETFQNLMNGDDFGDTAILFSDGPSAPNGGDLGWFSRGQMVPEFEEAAFAGEVGEIVGPVQTQFGYHIIQILGHEDRPGSESEYNQAINAILTDILNNYIEETDIEFPLENWLDYTPTEPDILRLSTNQ